MANRPCRYGGSQRGSGSLPSMTSSSAFSSPKRYSSGPRAIVTSRSPSRPAVASSRARAFERLELAVERCLHADVRIVRADRERGDEAPFTTWYGSRRMIERSLNVPGSPSAPLPPRTCGRRVRRGRCATCGRSGSHRRRGPGDRPGRARRWSRRDRAHERAPASGRLPHKEDGQASRPEWVGAGTGADATRSRPAPTEHGGPQRVCGRHDPGKTGHHGDADRYLRMAVPRLAAGSLLSVRIAVDTLAGALRGAVRDRRGEQHLLPPACPGTFEQWGRRVPDDFTSSRSRRAATSRLQAGARSRGAGRAAARTRSRWAYTSARCCCSSHRISRPVSAPRSTRRCGPSVRGTRRGRAAARLLVCRGAAGRPGPPRRGVVPRRSRVAPDHAVVAHRVVVLRALSRGPHVTGAVLRTGRPRRVGAPARRAVARERPRRGRPTRC